MSASANLNVALPHEAFDAPTVRAEAVHALTGPVESTASHGRVGVKPAPIDWRVVVIGENMRRVGPAARALSASHYRPRAGRTDAQMDRGARLFVYKAAKAGKVIYTVGTDPNKANYPAISSPSFKLEILQLIRMGVPLIGCDQEGRRSLAALQFLLHEAGGEQLYALSAVHHQDE